jgi:hypothetical protein
MSAPRALFIGGSINQTKQMHEVSKHLGDYEQAFTPYYTDDLLDLARRAGLVEFTVLGNKLRRRCLDYLERHRLPIDVDGRRGPYDLVLSCSDLVVPRNIMGSPIVLVQEGILDPPSLGLTLWRLCPWLPLWLGGTATTGLSGHYARFCVASAGYREQFIANGAPADRVVVTGIPNFDRCEQYRNNDFPHRGYVLVCTSDARETLKGDDRRGLIQSALDLAKGRLVIFKLHPNEKVERATREIHRWAPGALVYADGSAEEMIANCDVLVTQYSSVVFVGLALGKEVHSYFDLETLRRLLPVQNGRAAANIAAVCREVVAGPTPEPVPRPGTAAATADPNAVWDGAEA